MKRSSFGNIALATFLVAFILIMVSLLTSSWLTSDKGAQHNSMGLWTHCFTWQSDPKSLYDRRFLVGCQEYIRGFSVPSYNRRVMTTTQIFFTLSFISAIIGAILSLLYFFWCRPDNKRFIKMLKVQSWTCLLSAILGMVAILVFITQRDVYVWMPFHNEIYFGWSLYVGMAGVVVMYISAAYFFRDVRIHARAEISQSRGDVGTNRGKFMGTPSGHTVVDVLK